MEILTPGLTSLAQLRSLYAGALPAELHRDAREDVERAARQVADAAACDTAVYGVNTGVGSWPPAKLRVLILKSCNATSSFRTLVV